MHSQSLAGKTIADRIQKAEALYPSVRYFQIHFEFLQEQFQQTLRILESMQAQIRQLELQARDYNIQREMHAETLQSKEGQQDSFSSTPLIQVKQVRRR